jgi:hypothetical protein
MGEKVTINNDGELHFAMGFGGPCRPSIMPTNGTTTFGNRALIIVLLTPSSIFRVRISPNEWEEYTSYCKGLLPL